MGRPIQPTGPNRPTGARPPPPGDGSGRHAQQPASDQPPALSGQRSQGQASPSRPHMHTRSRARTSFIRSPRRVGWTTWWPWRGAPTRSHPELGRENPQRPWYCVSRRGRVGRRQVLQPTRKNHTPAGWSSPVARQAHNLKVTGSNPVPATNDDCVNRATEAPAARTGWPALSPSDAKPGIAARSPQSVITSPPFAGVGSIALTSDRRISADGMGMTKDGRQVEASDLGSRSFHRAQGRQVHRALNRERGD